MGSVTFEYVNDLDRRCSATVSYHNVVMWHMPHAGCMYLEKLLMRRTVVLAMTRLVMSLEVSSLFEFCMTFGTRIRPNIAMNSINMSTRKFSKKREVRQCRERGFSFWH